MPNDLIDLKELENLSEEERKYAIEILKEFSKNGSSETYSNLVNSDYKEVPVDIITFIKDRKYLGNAWHSPDGSCKLYEYWENKLKELFPDPYTTKYNNFIESGARGLGKSEIAITVGLYLMHRIMCLKDPRMFFNLKPTENIAFAFMNITITLSEDIGITKFQATVKESPWFMQHGTLTKRNNEPYWIPPNPIKMIIGSQSSHVVGQSIYFAFFDEISFIRNQDIDRQKAIAIDMIDTAIGGMKTRFLHNGKNPTLLVLASSKRSEKSFLEEHMKKKLADDDASALIVDEPVWNVKPKSTYSGKTFKVAKGNRFLPSEIIPDGEDENIYISKGYSILNVPIEFRTDFRDDIDRALCDFAGVSSSDITKYISGAKFIETVDEKIKNPFTKEILEIGTDDNLQYYDFFDMERVPKEMLSKPLYIHLDMSVSGDKTGISGTWIAGKRHSSNNESSNKEVYFQTAFGVAIKAPKGRQISFEKNRLFIYWLKEQGFNIRGITSDTFQNVSLGQDLISKGFDYTVLSVDRVNSEKICEPYAYFKTVVYEKRIITFYCKLLQEEVVGLERNTNSGKVDHPNEGKSGSKDLVDAVVGSIFNASKHADEFAFDYGETLDTIKEVSSERSLASEREQISVDFQNELNRIFDPINGNKNVNINNNNNNFKNFGMGKATSNFSTLYSSQGIIVF